MGMTDQKRKEAIKRLRAQVENQQQIIDGYSKQITELKTQLEDAQHKIHQYEVSTGAKIE